MSSESQWDIQKALYDVLRADTQITSLLEDGQDSVFDYVPTKSERPYLVLGDSVAEPFETQTERGLKITLSLHIYSGYRGMREIKDIMRAVYEQLHHKSDFAITNQEVVMCRLLSSRVSVEDKGKTRHSVQRFEIMTEPKI